MKHCSVMKGVSVRMHADDHNKLKRIAGRLSVRESDIIRYSVKTILRRLAPLAGENCSNDDLLPVFIEHGAELSMAFDLCAEKLGNIFNQDDDDSGMRITRKDIELLTTSGAAESYQLLRIKEAVNHDSETKDLRLIVKEYLYEKYLSQPQRLLQQAKETNSGTN